MAIIFDSPETASPIKYYFAGQTYTPSVSGLRFDTPDSIGGTFIFDIQSITGEAPGGGATGAAMFHHLRNLGIY